jgi:glycosyltransferase involved in cell wall biosynthesis/SAM-dependent methyltransferase
MKILVVADVSPVVVRGGGERVLAEQAGRLHRAGHRVRVVSRTPEGEGDGALMHGGIPVRHFPVKRGSLLAFVRTSIVEARRAVADELDRHGADVLHLHQPLSALGALTSRPGRRLPSLYTFHSPAPLEFLSRQGTTWKHRRGAFGGAGAALLWVLERASLSRATRIHVLSDFSAALLWKLYRIRGDRVVRIPGGVDLERFRSADQTAVRRRLGLAPGRPILFTLRNLEARMGLDRLLVAFDRVRHREPDALLLIGGAGTLRQALEAQTAELGLERHVKFLGYVAEDELALYYQAADAFLLPTRELEGFGLVTPEALACGTPVLGTPIGATPELLRALSPSLIFRDASARAIADGLEAFLDERRQHPETAASLRQSCRRYAETRFGWQTSVDRVADALAELRDSACPACGASTIADRRSLGRSWHRCPHCGTAVQTPRPSRDELRRHYEITYPTVFSPSHADAARQNLFGTILDDVELRPGATRLLDAGAAGGHLMAAAVRRGWRAIGFDIAHEACVTAHKATGAATAQADAAVLPIRDAAADVVTLVNMLDHLPEPAAALQEAARVLAPGGRLVVRVPNGGFHRRAARLLGGRSIGGYHPVLHVVAFTRRGLVAAVGRAGLRVQSLNNSPFAVTPTSGLAGRLVPRLLSAAAALVVMVSGGAWLIAPSLILHAERPVRRPELEATR